MSVFQRAHDSEINFAVSVFWDGCFDVKLGDELNGFVAEAQVRSWSEVEVWLDAAIRKHFPESGYVRKAENIASNVAAPPMRITVTSADSEK